jgi:cell division inhibitor SepF
MAGALRKTMVYLGLAEDERDDGYESYEEYDESPAHQDQSERHERSAPVTSLPARTPVARVVRDVEVGALNRIWTIHPRTYNEAKNIGESFREGTPVIMNLTDLGDADAKRLVDFAAGLVFGLHGSIERVTSKVFLLSPAHVEVTASEVAPPKAASRAFFNQS